MYCMYNFQLMSICTLFVTWCFDKDDLVLHPQAAGCSDPRTVADILSSLISRDSFIMMVRKSFCSSLLMTLIWSTGSRVSAHSPNFSHSQSKQLIFDLNDDLGTTESIFRSPVTDHAEQSPLVSLVVGANYSVVTVLIQTIFTPRIPHCLLWACCHWPTFMFELPLSFHLYI